MFLTFPPRVAVDRIMYLEVDETLSAATINSSDRHTTMDWCLVPRLL